MSSGLDKSLGLIMAGSTEEVNIVLYFEQGIGQRIGELLEEECPAQKLRLEMSWVAGPLGVNLRLPKKSWVLLSTYYVPALF